MKGEGDKKLSNGERDPSAVAARYRVKQVGETEFELCTTQGTSTNLNVRRLGTFLHFRTTPRAVRWHAAERSEAFHVVQLLVGELDIGFRGEEGWSSGLVDNCFFIIDDEALRYVPLTELRILSEEQFNVEKARLAASKGETLVTKPERDGHSDTPVGRATIVHCPAMPEHDIGESLECTVGLRQAHFQQL